jgi:hypothetical protein
MIDITISRNLVINILVHVFILFIFLYIFFFNFIAKSEEDAIADQVNNISNNKIPEILANIDNMDKDKVINWEDVKKKAENVLNSTDQSVDKNIEDNNNSLKKIGIIIIVSILLLTITIYVYYTFILKKSVSLKKILVENVTVFSLVGIIEYIFFKMTASKYIPVYPDTIGNTVLESIKNNIMNT